MSLSDRIKHLIITTLSFKQIDERNFENEVITITKDRLGFFCLSSNTIWVIDFDDGVWFFRPCEKKTKKSSYFRDSIDFFFDYVVQNVDLTNFNEKTLIETEFDSSLVSAFKEYIYKKLDSDNKIIKRLSKTDCLFHDKGYSIWDIDRLPDFRLAEMMGFGDIETRFQPIFPLFSNYLRGSASNYKNSLFVKPRNISFISGGKNVASSIIAKELGVSDLITESRICSIKIGDSIWRGVISQKAKGKRALDTEETITPSVHRDLTTLNLLDIICRQKDHGPNNYNVIVDNKQDQSLSVCAFDNDNPTTFFPDFNIYFSTSGCSPFFGKKGLINRPHLEKRFADSIMNFDLNQINKLFGECLNVFQRKALRCRIKRIQAALRYKIEDNGEFLTSCDKWDQKTIQEELNNYKNTYLHRFIGRN